MKKIAVAILLNMFLFLGSQFLNAQNFTVLKWGDSSVYTIGRDSVEHPFNFKDAAFFDNDVLPHYTESFRLDDDLGMYNYDIAVEYPEYERVPVWQRKAVEDLGIVLPPAMNVSKRIVKAAGTAYLTVDFVPMVYRNGDYYRVKSFRLNLKKSASARVQKSPKSDVGVQYADNSVLASGKWVKIAVQNSGIYSISHSKLASMGFSDPSKVAVYGYGGNLLNEDFSKYYCDDLPEVPLIRTSNSLLFYAEGTRRIDYENNILVPVTNYSSDYGYYFLTEKENPSSFQESEEVPEGKIVTESLDFAFLKSDELYAWSNFGNRLYDSYDFRYGNRKDYNFSLPAIVNSENVNIQVAFAAGYTTTSNYLKIYAGGSEIAKSGSLHSNEEAQYAKARRGVVSAKYRIPDGESSLTLTLEHQNSGSISGRLDYILVNYTRKLEMTSSSLVFYNTGNTGNVTYKITNANSSTVVLDVTNPGQYKRMKVSLDGSEATFSDNVSDYRKYVAFNTNSGFSEGYQVVGEISNQNLHSLREYDMVIIVPSGNKLYGQAERLAEEHRKRDGLNVVTVNAGNVYNEFSSGTPDPTAYRRLMKMLYDTSVERKPKYLLLFGDCSYDNRLRTSAWSGYSTDDLLLCYMPEESEVETNTFFGDDYFGFLDDNEGKDIGNGRNVIDIGIGRLPVLTESEASVVVDKFIRYMDNADKGDWKNLVCITADDNLDAGGTIHMKQGDNLGKYIESLNEGYMVERLFIDLYKRENSSTGYSYPSVVRKLNEMFNDGMFVITYIGHSNPDFWSSKKILTSNDIVKMKSDRIPLWITASCEFTRMDAVTRSSGELAVLNGQGGAVGIFSATRVVYISYNDEINRIYNKYLFGRNEKGEHYTLGEVFMKTKQECSMNIPNRNHMNYVFLGDPALRLTYPDNNKLVVDSINGVAAGEGASINAGTISEVVGHAVDRQGNELTDFTGKMEITVMDSKKLMTSLNNANIYYDDKPDTVQFMARTNNLYLGQDSVVNGRFQFKFPVPLDMSYSNQNGLINLYAGNDSTEANVGFEDFKVGGTEGEFENDGEGPSISAYLNSVEKLTTQVNRSPVLYVNLSDMNGINISGAGVGHDIVAEIDNNPNYFYTLNNYYVPESPYSGSIAYKFNELPVGKHNMVIRAWDALNNSSTMTIDFEVVQDLKPTFFDVSCISPASEKTTFFVSHDMPDSDVNMILEVFDYSGSAVVRKEFDDVSSSSVYTFDWDLCTAGGAALDSGVYLYRISMSVEGGEYTSQTKKIVIIRQ